MKYCDGNGSDGVGGLCGQLMARKVIEVIGVMEVTRMVMVMVIVRVKAKAWDRGLKPWK